MSEVLTTGLLEQVDEFLPRRFLRNGHLQTLVGNFAPRRYVLPEAAAHLVEVDRGRENGTRTDATPELWAIAIGSRTLARP
jgi:hypothetical protein